ncbi:TatD family hydrolase [Deltaproteobacteria bacterium]|nr:TatD family hydrolase [Deltaproteobacteria bacterium]
MSKKHHHKGPPTFTELLARLPRLPRLGVDSHAHLDMNAFDEDREAVLERAEMAGLALIGNVFLRVEDWEKGRNFFPAENFFFLMGIHPSDAASYSSAVRDAMQKAFAVDSRLRAVGEIGLDFYWKDVAPEAQIPVFIDQLHLARNLNRPVVIHSRDAFAATMTILQEEHFFDYPLLWHCFTGNAEEAKQIMDAGWHISIPGPVTFKTNGDLRAALSVIDPKRLLVETDCPYLAPMPFRGRRNEPAYVVFTAVRIAEELGVPVEALWARCGENARRFFGV